MMNALFSFEPFDFSGAQGVNSPHQGYGTTEEGVIKGKQNDLFGIEDRGDNDYLCSEYCFPENNTPRKLVLLSKDQPPTPISDFGILDDFHFDVVSTPIQSSQDSVRLESILTEISDLVEPKKSKRCPISLASLELLNKYRSGVKRLNGEKLNEQHRETDTTVDGRRLSTEEVMRVAGAQYIQHSDKKDNDLSMLRHPFGYALLGLSDEETKDVQLAHFLLASAEKVEHQQFHRANKLLTQCEHLSSCTGSPVQRAVFYFAEALRERINRQTGRIPSQEMGKGIQPLEVEEEWMGPNPAILAYHQELPFSQMLHIAGMQAIMEYVASAKQVHLIDLRIRFGMHWTVLMQALASRNECPLELLKITAVGLGTTSKQKIEETGKRLVSFAKTMNLPFSFKVVIVSDMKDLKQDLFELEAEEEVVVYSSFFLRTMIAQPDCLESLMRVIRNISPGVMVVSEMEANHNSPSFVNRFIEALFYYSVLFDCVETCMDRNNQNRLTIEGRFIRGAIQNIVASEGEERTMRHVGINVWRAFFAQFGLMETELSQSSLYQASLVVKQFACGSSCTLDMNGKCLTVGWKGTPIHSLSVWKFH